MSPNEKPVCLGLDIGGANIKASDSNGNACSVPFALWEKPDQLSDALAQLIARFPATTNLAVTMTGELADCYATKQEGVSRIVEAVESVWSNQPMFYSTDCQFISASEASENWNLVAAANWHALASFAGRYVPKDNRKGNTILIDIGSTTTDIIPIQNGKCTAKGLTDTDRLISGELVYAGVNRTPIASLVDEVSYRGQPCALARELFATTLDVFLILAQLPGKTDSPQASEATADGRPASKLHSQQRLARMICADSSSFHEQDAVSLATEIVEQLKQLIAANLKRVANRFSDPISTIIVSGEGEFLARQIASEFNEQNDLRLEIKSLSQQFTPEVASAAPAFAVAMLAAEGVGS